MFIGPSSEESLRAFEVGRRRRVGVVPRACPAPRSSRLCSGSPRPACMIRATGPITHDVDESHDDQRLHLAELAGDQQPALVEAPPERRVRLAHRRAPQLALEDVDDAPRGAAVPEVRDAAARAVAREDLAAPRRGSRRDRCRRCGWCPGSTVTGRSVFSRSVRHGTPSTVVSSWMPPESVSTSRASAIRPQEVEVAERLGDACSRERRPPSRLLRCAAASADAPGTRPGVAAWISSSTSKSAPRRSGSSTLLGRCSVSTA